MIEKNYENDKMLTDFGKETLKDRYLLPNEDYQSLFARVAGTYADDDDHAQRLYHYMSRLWFMPATPILSNGGAERGLPISCFLNEADDTLKGIADLWYENIWLSSKGGGIGSYWGNLRSIGETVHRSGKTSGVIPFIKVQDAMVLAISQGSIRRGSAAVYLPVWHPEIEEFLDIRRASGGDPNRKSLNIHHGIVIDDHFMEAVKMGLSYALRSPKDDSVVSHVDARSLWIKILTTRLETGEPYLLFIDNVNRRIPEHHRRLDLKVKTSNLCSEITLPTGKDHHGMSRTAVCCLSSVNLEYFDEWKDHPYFLEDIARFLDNVLDDFIKNAPESMSRASYSAMRERSIGLGVMGFHSYLQKNMIPWESALAKSRNIVMFRTIREAMDKASYKLAIEKGSCPDATECGKTERFSNKMAIAPTASISIICGNASPGIEPHAANSYTHKTMTGSFNVRNKHLDDIIKRRIIQEQGAAPMPGMLAPGKDKYDEIWSNITTNEGSIQHIDFFTEEEKLVFKTAPEIDQRWLVELAADRTPHVCQAQSLNLFLPPNVHKKYLSDIHFLAWQLGVKSLYYLRSSSIQRAEKSAAKSGINFEECIACQ